jgi:hypothetical protein
MEDLPVRILIICDDTFAKRPPQSGAGYSSSYLKLVLREESELLLMAIKNPAPGITRRNLA